jgi:non-histone protein 10
MEAGNDASLPPGTGSQAASTVAPLAPSQEAAYRRKCIQLKKRLVEIETNNDVTRRRIDQEKQHVQKMRLMRAILLDHLKTIAETPGKRLSPAELQELGLRADGRARLAEMVAVDGEARPEGEGLLDDSSDESEDDPEVLPLPKKIYNRKSAYPASSQQNDPNAAAAPTTTTTASPS